MRNNLFAVESGSPTTGRALAGERRQLRLFGLSLALLVQLCCWFVVESTLARLCLLVASLLIAVVAGAAPLRLKAAQQIFQRITRPVHRTITEAGLLILYFGLFTPLGLLFKLARRSAILTHPDDSLTSYWQRCRPNRPRSDYFRQS